MNNEMVCDFCSSPDVSWMFPASDFEMYREQGEVSKIHISEGEWAACEICHHLIVQELWDDLERRAIANFGVALELHSPVMIAMVAEVVRASNARFQNNRTGPAVQVGGEKNV
jgi:hypothetical protein